MFRPRSVVSTLVGLALAGTAGAQTSHYHVVKTIDIGAVRADYIIIDPIGRRLYGLGDKVIDVDNDNIVGTIAGGGGGYAIDHEDNRGLVRNGTVFDLKTGAVTGHLAEIKGDGSRYDPVTHRAFVWVDKDGWVVDMRTGKLVYEDDDWRRARVGRGRRAREALRRDRGQGWPRAVRYALAEDRDERGTSPAAAARRA